jgi:hypothetical protein
VEEIFSVEYKVRFTDPEDGGAMPTETSVTISYSAWRSQKTQLFKETPSTHCGQNNKILDD